MIVQVQLLQDSTFPDTLLMDLTEEKIFVNRLLYKYTNTN